MNVYARFCFLTDLPDKTLTPNQERKLPENDKLLLNQDANKLRRSHCQLFHFLIYLYIIMKNL